MKTADRIPLPSNELLLLKPTTRPTDSVIRSIIDFNKGYQVRGLKTFAKFKLEWERLYPGRRFPGLCAEVNSITGEMRPLKDQRAWSWGDARALGIWSYFLIKARVPNENVKIALDSGEEATINLKSFYENYVDLLYSALTERLDQCGGKLPFLVDIETNRASDDPRNIPTREDEWTASHIFGAGGILQYGILRDSPDAIRIGLKLLGETFLSAHENRYVSHMTRKKSFAHTHGSMMVAAGAVVDTLKAADAKPKAKVVTSEFKDELVRHARWALDTFCGYHWNASDKFFAENIHPIYKTPYPDANGVIICDPGHAAEGVGFFAELYSYLPKKDKSSFRIKKDNVLDILSAILRFVDKRGYSDQGVMYKTVNALTGEGVADVIDNGKKYRTAPWWNVREAAAAASKLFSLTGDPAMWKIYLRALNATYRNYPNAAIGGLMVQTLDGDTLRALPFHPATGNLDPMHSPRAREREIEALSVCLRRKK